MALQRHGERLRWQGIRFAAFLAAGLALLSPQTEAQTPVSGFTGISGDNAKKPIDIESDRLEVDDKKHLAIFIGNVTATQGDYNLRAPRLEVTYEKASQPAGQEQSAAQASKPVKPVNAGAADPSADPISSGQIKFIHATGGKVVMTSKKDDQEVTGEEAVYDVKGQKITVTGKEVILTQKKNVVKGKQLDVDLATGRATVIPNKGRVQAIFTQEATKGVISGNPFTGAKKKDDVPEADTQKSSSPGFDWQPQSR